MRSHHTNIQLYTVMKISNHKKSKHTNINKLFLFLFVCNFLCSIIAVLMWKLLL